MSLVTDTLLYLVRKQVQAHGTVVWYDPEKAYLTLAKSLTSEVLAGAALCHYEPEQGFIRMRREVEPLWGQGTVPPRLVLYVPLAQAATVHALVEFEAGGVVMAPGQHPPECNTALALVARRALAGIRPPAALEQIVAEVESGKWSLAELDREAERGLEVQAGVLKLVFETGNATEIALRFLAEPAIDAKIEEKQALASLARLLSETLGVPFGIEEGTVGLRARLARQILVTDFIQACGEKMPPALSTFAIAERPVARQAAAELAQAWRNRRDAASSYVHWADTIQAEIGVGSLELDLRVLSRSEAFAGGEARLQGEVEMALAKHASPQLVGLAQVRLLGFWSGQRPQIKARWDVIVDAGRVLIEAARVTGALKGKVWTASALVSSYASADEPWCALDTAQRHTERDFHRFELDIQQHETLIQLVACARQRYAEVSDDLAELFTRAYEADKFHVGGLRLQADIHHDLVVPAAKNGRMAYILVDALRFEMASELAHLLAADWKTELTPALATPPTVTEIGMAALMPGAEHGLMVVAVEGGKLGAVVGGRTLRSREERMDHLKGAIKGNVVVTRVDQLAPLSDVHLGHSLKSADVIVATATDEIDGLCETNPPLARRMLDDALHQLRRAVKTLFGLGVKTIVITADHGYLFGEKLTTGEGIDPPGGKTVLLKRRVWSGQGGAQIKGVLRAPLSAFGLGGDLEIATPRNLSAFKAPGGGMEYLHGGLSMQELVIPVLIVQPAAVQAAGAGARLEWKLSLGSPKITTRFLSVTIEGYSQELLPIEPPSVRVEVRAGDQAISVPIAATYGFGEATKDVRLKLEAGDPQQIAVNTVTLMITETPSASQVTVHLLDASTGLSLDRLDRVPFAVSI